MNTQLTSANGYDISRMIFSEPQVGSIPDSKPAISFRRINISTINDNGTVGELIFPTENLYSFGVSENTSLDTGKINGYVMPLCLWSRDSPTPNERAWTDTFDRIVERCKDHLIEHKDEIEQYDLERVLLKKLNPLYWKKDKGKVVEGTGPTLYAKLLISKKQDKIISMFYNTEGAPINPLELLGKHCNARAAIKIESIFIGTKISLQVKLYECEVTPKESGMRRLLTRPTANPRVLNQVSTNSNPLASALGKDDSDSDSDGSLESEDDEIESKPTVVSVTAAVAETKIADDSKPPAKTVKTVKKVVKATN